MKTFELIGDKYGLLIIYARYSSLYSPLSSELNGFSLRHMFISLPIILEINSVKLLNKRVLKNIYRFNI